MRDNKKVRMREKKTERERDNASVKDTKREERRKREKDG